MIPLRIGFVPLTDAAVLIAAAERGFAARRGLAITLVREPSWATLRDELTLGVIDAAHILAPLAIALSLGLSPGGPLPMIAPFALNLNGNAVTVSASLWRAIAAAGPAGSPAEVAAGLASVARERRDRGDPPLTFATVFPYATHTLQLRTLFALGGLDAERDIVLTVVPPPHMVDALRGGIVDGFCVGSPWNTVAVESGVGRIALLGSALVPDAPEKVLAYPPERFDAEVTQALVEALVDAADWCSDPSRRGELADLLAEPTHLGIDAALIRRTLEGRLLVDPSGEVVADPAYLRIGGRVHRPEPEHARWLCRRMAEIGQMSADPRALARAASVYDPSFFDAATQ